MIMDKRDVFFANYGLTSTSANHIANMAKEFIMRKRQMVEYLRFVTCSMTLVSDSPGKVLEESKGMTAEDFPAIEKAYEDIYKAQALISWLREGIKAKESFSNEINNLTIEKYCEIKGITLPQSPVRETTMTEDEYYASLPVKDRVRYYNLETKCAVLGNAIHPERPFSVARKELFNAMAEPSKLTRKESMNVIAHRTPSVSAEAVDNFFFKLQNAHREAQAELNSIKFACEKAISADYIVKANAYNLALADYNAKYAAVQSEMALYRRTRSSEISALRIVIPDALKEIYEKINNLGK